MNLDGYYEAWMVFLPLGSIFQPNITPDFAASHECLT